MCNRPYFVSDQTALGPFFNLYLTVKLARLVSDENNVTEFLTYTAGAKCGFRCEKEYVVTNVL